MNDPEFGLLHWDDGWWVGEIYLASQEPFELFIFARASETADREITAEARQAIRWFRVNEDACRKFAAEELLEIQQSEWSDSGTTTEEQFLQTLRPESLVIHESGYAEIGFLDGGLFSGHAVEVRRRADGGFQEACLGG